MQGRRYSGYRTEHSTEHGTEVLVWCCRVNSRRVIDSALWSGICLLLLCRDHGCFCCVGLRSVQDSDSAQWGLRVMLYASTIHKHFQFCAMTLDLWHWPTTRSYCLQGTSSASTSGHMYRICIYLRSHLHMASTSGHMYIRPGPCP